MYTFTQNILAFSALAFLGTERVNAQTKSRLDLDTSILFQDSTTAEVSKIDLDSDGETDITVNHGRTVNKAFLEDVSKLPLSLNKDRSALCCEIFKLIDKHYLTFDPTALAAIKKLQSENRDLKPRYAKADEIKRKIEIYEELIGLVPSKNPSDYKKIIAEASMLLKQDGLKPDALKKETRLTSKRDFYLSELTNLTREIHTIELESIGSKGVRPAGHDPADYVGFGLCPERASLGVVALRSRGLNAITICLPGHVAIFFPDSQELWNNGIADRKVHKCEIKNDRHVTLVIEQQEPIIVEDLEGVSYRATSSYLKFNPEGRAARNKEIADKLSAKSGTKQEPLAGSIRNILDKPGKPSSYVLP